MWTEKQQNGPVQWRMEYHALVFPLKFCTNTAYMGGQFCPKSAFCLAGLLNSATPIPIPNNFLANAKLAFLVIQRNWNNYTCPAPYLCHYRSLTFCPLRFENMISALKRTQRELVRTAREIYRGTAQFYPLILRISWQLPPCSHTQTQLYRQKCIETKCWNTQYSMYIDITDNTFLHFKKYNVFELF